MRRSSSCWVVGILAALLASCGGRGTSESAPPARSERTPERQVVRVDDAGQPPPTPVRGGPAPAVSVAVPALSSSAHGALGAPLTRLDRAALQAGALRLGWRLGLTTELANQVFRSTLVTAERDEPTRAGAVAIRRISVVLYEVRQPSAFADTRSELVRRGALREEGERVLAVHVDPPDQVIAAQLLEELTTLPPPGR